MPTTLDPLNTQTKLPAGFVYLDTIISNIEQGIDYFDDNNFVGEPIDGYHCRRAILSEPAAQALGKVQQTLDEFALGLKIFDAYRPQRAVDHFLRWSNNPGQNDNKAQYYPNIEKPDLFKEGYIALRSSHTRGSTVDLTIVDLHSKQELDMGSGFDFFGPESWLTYEQLTATQRANRLLLQQVMQQNGFEPFVMEWWHFTLKNEPYPDSYFDFPVA